MSNLKWSKPGWGGGGPGPEALSLDFLRSYTVSSSIYARSVGAFEWWGNNYITLAMYVNGMNIYVQDDDGSLSLVQQLPGGAGVARYHGGPVAVGNKLFCPAREEGLLVYDLNKLGTVYFVPEKVILPPDSTVTTGSVPKTTGLHYDAAADVLYLFQRTGGWNAIQDVSITDFADLSISPTLHRYTTDEINLEVHRGDVVSAGGRRVLPVPSLSTNILLTDDVTDGENAVMSSFIRKNRNGIACWDIKDIGQSRVLATQWAYVPDFKHNFGVGIYDYSVPERPKLMGRLEDAELPYFGANRDSPPYDIWLSHNVAFVAGGPTGIWAVNYGNSYAPYKEAVAEVPDKPVPEFGYTSVAVAGNYVYACACDIPNLSAAVRLDVYSVKGAASRTVLYRGFVQAGQTEPYLIDEFFTEDFTSDGDKLLCGTRNFAQPLWESDIVPPVNFGDGSMVVSFAPAAPGPARRFYLFAPMNTGLRSFSVAGNIKVTGTLPLPGQYYICDFAYVQTPALVSTGYGLLQLLITPNMLNPSKLNCILRLRNNNGTYNAVSRNEYASSGEVFSFRAQLDLDAGRLAFKVNRSPWVENTFTEDYTSPTHLCLAVSRDNTEDLWNYDLSFEERLIFADGIQDIDPARVNIWEKPLASAPQENLRWEGGAATRVSSLDGLTSDGEWYYDDLAGKLYLYSLVDPNTANWGLYYDG